MSEAPPPAGGRPRPPATPGAPGAVAWSQARLPHLPPVSAGAVDANSYLGEWPGRRLHDALLPDPRAEVAERLQVMDRFGIRQAVVSRLEGVWLRDAGRANAELHALVGDLRARFFPVYTLNPAHPGWRDHLAQCAGEFGLAPGQGAVRLHPNYHAYAADDAAIAACLDHLGELGLPVILTVQLQDPRIETAVLRVADVEPEEVAALCSRWPSLRWIVAGATYAEVARIAALLPPRISAWFELSRVQGPIDDIRLLCEQVGSGRLLFGTNLPLYVPECAVMELADAALPEPLDAAIRYGNAVTALGLAAPP